MLDLNAHNISEQDLIDIFDLLDSLGMLPYKLARYYKMKIRFEHLHLNENKSVKETKEVLTNEFNLSMKAIESIIYGSPKVYPKFKIRK